mgnify:FL=1
MYTLNDLQSLNEQSQITKKLSSKKNSQKRYLMLIYNCEYDRVYYPLSLQYFNNIDYKLLIEQIRLLTIENQFLRSQVNCFILFEKKFLKKFLLFSFKI